MSMYNAGQTFHDVTRLSVDATPDRLDDDCWTLTIKIQQGSKETEIVLFADTPDAFGAYHE